MTNKFPSFKGLQRHVSPTDHAMETIGHASTGAADEHAQQSVISYHIYSQVKTATVFAHPLSRRSGSLKTVRLRRLGIMPSNFRRRNDNSRSRVTRVGSSTPRSSLLSRIADVELAASGARREARWTAEEAGTALWPWKFPDELTQLDTQSSCNLDQSECSILIILNAVL